MFGWKRHFKFVRVLWWYVRHVREVAGCNRTIDDPCISGGLTSLNFDAFGPVNDVRYETISMSQKNPMTTLRRSR